MRIGDAEAFTSNSEPWREIDQTVKFRDEKLPGVTHGDLGP
jgi:hypothetical protein